MLLCALELWDAVGAVANGNGGWWVLWWVPHSDGEPIMHPQRCAAGS